MERHFPINRANRDRVDLNGPGVSILCSISQGATRLLTEVSQLNSL